MYVFYWFKVELLNNIGVGKQGLSHQSTLCFSKNKVE